MTILNCLPNGGFDVGECSGLRSESCPNPIVVGVHHVGFLPTRFEYPCRKVNCPLAQGVGHGRTGERVTVCIKLAVSTALEIRPQNETPSERDYSCRVYAEYQG